MTVNERLAAEFHLKLDQVDKTVALIDEGNTIPFISRYRKEVTGGLDDNILRDLLDKLTSYRALDKRKEEVFNLISEQGKMTPELEAAIANARTVTEVEDIYRPYRPHRKTRASVARERGLEPLAQLMMEMRDRYEPPIEEEALKYVSEEAGVPTAEAALSGACDIIAEDISDNAEFRKYIRALTVSNGEISSKAADAEKESPYTQYYDFSEPLRKIPGHRVLAINRGEKEEFLKVSVTVEPSIPLDYLRKNVITNNDSPALKYVEGAIEDSYSRLIEPSIEREVRSNAFDAACEGALKVFEDNLHHLLMQTPIKGKTVLGFDPGYGHGCKLAVVDQTGRVVDTAVIYPHKPQEQTEKSRAVLAGLIRKHKVDIVSIGNGTASRESEHFVAQTIHDLGLDCKYIIVSEAGASVYSASKLAAEEFPDFDVMQRSAVSIARRLQDPLAELVKIEPRAIGVGQYQHDMKEARLDTVLTGVVEDCVNAVGVDLNTASGALLSYVSGMNKVAAKNIVKYREENGLFRRREDVLRVPRVGEKLYEQCAGFLRVPESDEILDNTGVHPESYEATRRLLSTFGYTEQDVRDGGIELLPLKITQRGREKVAQMLGVGVPTLDDIVKELEKPGRDIRDSYPTPELRSDVMDLEDLKPGMELTGTVRNVVDFGAFVDIGVHQDGLVHISEITNKFIRHPSEVLSVNDIVTVWVLGVDVRKKRISLTMKKPKAPKEEEQGKAKN